MQTGHENNQLSEVQQKMTLNHKVTDTILIIFIK